MIRHHIHRQMLSFGHAFRGIMWAIKTEKSYAVHLTLSALSLFGALIFRISYIEFLILIILIFGGLAMEMVNTAIEETTDAIDTKWREDIRRAKDVAAGAMLTYAFGAFIVACCVFIPRILLFIFRN